MEPDQTERAETVVNADRSGRQVVVSGRERMEMRDADRLRQQQNNRADSRYPANPAAAICLRVRMHRFVTAAVLSAPTE